tara:strand:+ start:2400 stop:3632 length:1233 start_codon:yes stop_codon:yes gene_type:complete
MDAPETLGKYKVESALGKGAMGVVYLATDPDIERRVAIKTLLVKHGDDEDLLERFRREAKAAGALNHPNVVTIYDYGEDDGTPYIVMELISGSDLQKVARRGERFTVNESFRIIAQVLDALAYFHDVGVIHRDIKPANIVLLGNGTVKVTDFGIARQENSDLTATGMVLGTPSYMSPEQFIGEKLDGRSDLFSVAVVLYELLTGEQPFKGDNVPTIMYQVSHEEAAPPTKFNARLPGAIDNVMRKALAKKPDERYPDAQSFAAALKEVADGFGDREDGTFFSGATLIAGGSDSSGPANEGATVIKPASASGGKRAPSIIGVVIATVIVIAAWFATSGAPEEFGTVAILSEPDKASVWLDGKSVGETPLELKLPSGAHVLTLRKQNFQDQEVSVDVEANAINDIYLPLTPK